MIGILFVLSTAPSLHSTQKQRSFDLEQELFARGGWSRVSMAAFPSTSTSEDVLLLSVFFRGIDIDFETTNNTVTKFIVDVDEENNPHIIIVARELHNSTDAPEVVQYIARFPAGERADLHIEMQSDTATTLPRPFDLYLHYHPIWKVESISLLKQFILQASTLRHMSNRLFNVAIQPLKEAAGLNADIIKEGRGNTVRLTAIGGPRGEKHTIRLSLEETSDELHIQTTEPDDPTALLTLTETFSRLRAVTSSLPAPMNRAHAHSLLYDPWRGTPGWTIIKDQSDLDARLATLQK